MSAEMPVAEGTLWLPVPEGVLSEDRAYLLGFLKACFPSVIVTRYDPKAPTLTPPEDDYDVVVQLFSFRNLDLFGFLKDIAAKRGVRITNPSDAARICCDKRNLPDMFAEYVPETDVVRSVEEVETCLQKWNGDIVLKPPYFGRGEHVTRISSPDDISMANDLFAISPSGDLVCQPFCEGFSAGDQRIFVVRDADGGGRILANFGRIPPDGSWMTNLSLGGRLETRPLSKREELCALDIFDRTGLDYVGLDLAQHDGREMLIELNPTAGGLIDYDMAHQTNSQTAIVDIIKRRIAQRD